MNTKAKPTAERAATVAPNHYRRIFGEAQPTTYTAHELSSLAKSMTDAANEFRTSDIPSGYTYFGQFLNHEISKPDTSTLNGDLSLFRNLHSPKIDLETLYGGGPANHPNLYDGDGIRLRLNYTSETTNPVLFDIPRKENSSGPDVYDNRNDENLALSQMHVLLVKFHNALVTHFREAGFTDFEAVRAESILHFQSIVVTDYLQRILDDEVYRRLLSGERRIFRLANSHLFLPAEFSMAAFRFGHCMIRDKYGWNATAPDEFTVEMLFDFTGKKKFTRCNTGNLTSLENKWTIDWRRFFDVGAPVKLNFSRELGPAMSPVLGSLRKSVECVRNNPETFSLTDIDLQLGRNQSLESGQKVARLLGCEALRVSCSPGTIEACFSDNTPLLFFILAEALAKGHGKRLGPVGSWVVGETLFELVSKSEISIFHDRHWRSVKGKREFSMPDLLRFIVEKEMRGWAAVNPNG